MDKQLELIMGQLQHLLKNGQIIQAIKLIRTVKNVSLKDAKNIVDQFKQQIETADNNHGLMSESGRKSQNYNSNTIHSSVNDSKYDHDFGHRHHHSLEKDLPTAAYLHLQRGEKIQAIKEICDVKGLSLQEAKSIVDRFYVQNPQYQIVQEQKKKNIIPLLIFFGIGLFILTKILS